MLQNRQTKKNNEIMVVTPDGPRGPIYQVKPGVVIAAREASACIVPITWSATRCWKLSTWDKLMLPKPFSTIHVKLGDSINIPKENKRNLKEEAKRLEEALLSLT